MSLVEQFDLTGRVAVVTGSGQGIGRAIAWGLADAGCDVVLNARRIDDLEVTAGGVRERGRDALIVAGDIRDLSEALADRTMERFGRIDIWVNNVGGSDEKTTRMLVDTPDDVFPRSSNSTSPRRSKGARLRRGGCGRGVRSSTSVRVPGCAGRPTPARTPRRRPG